MYFRNTKNGTYLYNKNQNIYVTYENKYSLNARKMQLQNFITLTPGRKTLAPSLSRRRCISTGKVIL